MSVLGFSAYDGALRFRHRRVVEFSPRWGFALGLALFSETGWSLMFQCLFGKLFIKLPWLPRREPHEIMESWGFSWDWGCRAVDIHLNWGRRVKILHMPWAWEHLRCDVLMADGSWQERAESWPRIRGRKATDEEFAAAREAHDKQDAERFRFMAPYRYCLRSFEVQRVEATVMVERREWRWRWFMWLPWPSRKQTSIDVKFSGEVGERAGSWKGGCIGCGYTMRKDETPQECLRRMERERKFT